MVSPKLNPGFPRLSFRDNKEARAVPLYFYSTVDGGSVPDHVGTEQPDDEAALNAAVSFAGEVMRDSPDVVRSRTGGFRVDLCDRDRCPLAVIRVLVDRSPADQAARG